MKSRHVLFCLVTMAAGGALLPMARAERLGPEERIDKLGGRRAVANFETSAFAEEGARNEVGGNAALRMRFLGTRSEPLAVSVLAKAAAGRDPAVRHLQIVRDGKVIVSETLSSGRQWSQPRAEVVYPIRPRDVQVGPHLIRLRGTVQFDWSLGVTMTTDTAFAKLATNLYWDAKPRLVLVGKGPTGVGSLTGTYDQLNGHFYVSTAVEPGDIRGRAYTQRSANGGDLSVGYRPRPGDKEYMVYDYDVPSNTHDFWNR